MFSSAPTSGRSSRGSSPPYPVTRRSRRPRRTATCTRRWRPGSASIATSPRLPCSARCTDRRPAGARRRCAASRPTSRSPWPTSPTRRDRPRAATICGPAAAGSYGWAASSDSTCDPMPEGRSRAGRAWALRPQCDGAGRGRRVLQDLGRGRAGPPRSGRRPGAHRPVPPRRTRGARTDRARATPSPAGSTTGCRRPPIAGSVRLPGRRVRFVADISVIARWSDAK